MNSSVQRYLEAATGLTTLTAGKAEQLVKQMVRSGEAAGDQVGELVEDLLDRQRKNRDTMAALVKSETVRAVRAMGLATTTEVERLQKQVADLKRELSRVQREEAAATPDDRSTRDSAGEQTAAKRSPGKKATSKKTGAKRATAKKATAAKTSKKTAAKRSPGKKTTKKSARKTSATKKSTS